METLEIKERLQTFDDILEYHGKTQTEFNLSNKGLPPDEIGNRKEKLIVAAYNEGKLPDWSDGTPKFHPWFKMCSSGFRLYDYGHWYSSSTVGSRLCFCGTNAKVNMLDAVKKFLPEYKESRIS